MPSDRAAELRAIVEKSLDAVMVDLNRALRGQEVARLEAVVERLGRGGVLPHWFAQLKTDGALPNADGKTIGSVLEMLLVAILEVGILKDSGAAPLKVNPARGVDLPDLELGVKSPSENFCTSEPFFSAYERLYGNEHDCLVMLTDYQTSKKVSPLRLKIINWKYMRGSEIADANLCTIARTHRDWLLEQGRDGEARAQRLFKFLAFVNQSDWQAKHLIRLVTELQKDNETIDALLDKVKRDYESQNKRLEKEDREPIPEEELTSLLRVRDVSPRFIGIMDQLDNWVTETLQDAARNPNANEWERLKKSPLDGKIGMSLALQWRYNFQRVFNGTGATLPECGVPAEDLMTSPTDTEPAK
jgi:hypothetical protein